MPGMGISYAWWRSAVSPRCMTRSFRYTHSLTFSLSDLLTFRLQCLHRASTNDCALTAEINGFFTRAAHPDFVGSNQKQP